jgi:nucleoid-associated protein YgaU
MPQIGLWEAASRLLTACFGNGKDMKNTTPILVLTGLAIAAAVGIAGLTREQWMGQPTPAVATPEANTPPAADTPAATAETAAPATPDAAAPEAPATAEAPAATPEAPATAEAPAATPEAPAAPEETVADTAVPAEQAADAEASGQPESQPEAVNGDMAAVQPETAVQPEAEPAPNAAAEPEVPAEVPAFDTVRVEKTGEAVIAGRAEAGSEVVVKLNGEEIGKTVANPDGAFVVVPDKPLPAGSGAITIEATGKGDLEPVASTESVAVIVPEGQPQQALVAVVSPDAPTKVLQKPEPVAEEPAPAQADAAGQQAPEEPAAEQKPAKLVSIDAVDYDPSGNIVFSGQGETGNTARIYVDNQFLGDAPVGEDGRWTFAGTADVAQGVHTLRVDGLDAQGSVVNRVEVPFFREEQTKVADATQPATPSTEQPTAEQPATTEAPAQPEQPVQQAETAVGEPAAAAPEAPAPVAEEQPPVAEQPAATAEAPEQPAAVQPSESQVAETPPSGQEQDAMQQPEESAAAAQAPEVASPVPSEGRIVIQPGNNLWRISRVLYGTGSKFTMLYEANKDQIRNPNLIYPGQVFRTPEVAPKAETIDPQRREPLAPDENAAAAE